MQAEIHPPPRISNDVWVVRIIYRQVNCVKQPEESRRWIWALRGGAQS